MKLLKTRFYTLVFVFVSALFIMARPEGKTVTYLPFTPSEDGLIPWNASRKLTWDDYKGEPDPQADAAASTTTLLTVSYKFSRNNFSFAIRSGFDPTRSWGTHRTAYILSHEQGHFDIAEVYARKLFQKLSEYKYDPRSYQKELKKIYEEVIKEKEKMQNEYDEQTRHSILRVRQEEWLKKIATMLHESAAFAGYQNNPYNSASTLRMISPKSSSLSANLFLSTSMISSFPSL